MANYPKLEEALYANKGVTGLPDTPALSAGEMQRKFDELSKDVIIPFINEHIDKMNGTDAASMLGVRPTSSMKDTEPTNVQEALEILDKMVHSSLDGASFGVDLATGHLIITYPDGTTGDFGVITFSPKGEFNPAAQYEKFNLVLYSGSVYVAIDTPPVGTLPTDSAYWDIFVDSTSIVVALDQRITDNTTAITNVDAKVNKALEIVSFDASTGELVTKTMTQ